MPSTQNPRPWLRRAAWILAWAFGLIVTLLVALFGVAVVLMTGQTGRDVVEGVLDGRTVAGYGTLQVSGLSGNPLGRMTIDELTMEDADGIWLRVRGFTLDWNTAALLSRHLEIDLLRARKIDVLRRPQPVAQARDGGGLPRGSLTVRELSIEELILADEVAGPRAVLTGFGSLERSAGVWRAMLDIARADQDGDTLTLIGEVSDRFTLEARLSAPAEGPLATLLGAGALGLAGQIDASGTLADGDGAFSLQVGDSEVTRGQLSWAGAEATLSAEVHPGRWPELERLQDWLGGPARIEAVLPLGDGQISNPDLEALTASVEAPALSLDVARDGEDRLRLTLHEASAMLAAITQDRVTASSASFTGALDLADPLRIAGQLSLTDLDLGAVGFATVGGPVEIFGPLGSPEIHASLQTTGARAESGALARILGDRPTLSATLAYDQDSGDLAFEQARLETAAGMMALQGLLNPQTGRFSARADSADIALARLTDAVAGRSAMTVQASGNLSAPISLVAHIHDTRLEGELQAYLGDEFDARVTADWTGGVDLVLQRLEASSSTLNLIASGALGESGWSVEGDAIWSGGAPLSALQLEGSATAAFAVSASDDVLTARAQLDTPRLGAGPIVLTSPSLRLDASGPVEQLAGSWRLTAESERGPVDLSGNASRTGDLLALTGITGRLGGLRVEAMLTASAETADLTLAATPVSGFGDIALTGHVGGGAMTLRAEARDLVRADGIYLDVLTLAAEGPLEAVSLALNGSGAFGARFDIAMSGEMRLANGPFQLSLAPEGRYGEVALATLEPLTLQTRDERTVLGGTLQLGEGSVRLALNERDGIPHASLQFESLPAALLSYWRNREPAAGLLSGSADFLFAETGWQGRARLAGRDLQPARAEDGLTVDLDASAMLSESGLRLGFASTAEGLTIAASLDVLSGPVSSLTALLDPGTSIEGDGLIDGEIASILAFHLPEGRQLSGVVDAQATLSGTIGAPDFSGEARLGNGAYRDDPLGLDITALEIEGRFAREGLELTRLDARGRNGGTVTGTGEVSFANADLSARSEISFTGFTLADRPDLMAEGDGNVLVRVENRDVRITGETSLSRVEARPPEARTIAIPRVRVTQINVPGRSDAAQEAIPDPGFDVSLDYQINAPARVYVRGQNFDTEWSLDMRVRGSPDDIRLRGDATLLRGRVETLGQPFVFETSTVTFAGKPANAALDLRATRAAREIEAQINIAGTIRAPQITLSSNPSLPQDEIASRLLFDQGAANLTGIQAAQLAAALSSAAGGFDPFGALRSAARLDQFSVGSNRAGETVVSGGRYLTDHVYLELATNGGAAPTTRIEWSLGRRLTLDSELTGTGNAALSLSWRLDYD